MRRAHALIVTLVALAAMHGTAAPAAAPTAEPPSGPLARRPERLPRVGNVFVENHGQVAGPVAYHVKGRGRDVFLTPQGVTFALTGHGARCAVKLDFVGADPDVRPQGREQAPTVVSYFKGPRTQWKTGLRTFREVVYADAWPGIDVVYRADADRVKTTYVVRPGADPARIGVRYRGAATVDVGPDGHLDIATPAGALRDEAPEAWQDTAQGRVAVSVAYALDAPDPTGARVSRFTLGEYDASQPLTIDPAVLVRCGFLGGSERDECRGMVVDGAGNAYLTGFTYSSQSSFPDVAGPDLTFDGGEGVDADAFVAKVDPTGTTLLYAGYIGGDERDEAYAIAVDGDGNAYVTGATLSSETSFPVTVGPDTTFNSESDYDAFVAKVNAAGTALVYAGYVGGEFFDIAEGIAVDSSGSAWLAGTTRSDQSTFPVTGGLDPTYNGGLDGFVAKVAPGGASLVSCGYLGGSDRDDAADVEVDALGNAYVVGTTASDTTTFPETVGPDLTFGGDNDAYIAKLDPTGATLLYCGYVGGDIEDAASGVAVDAAGAAYLTGSTDSSLASFGVIVGPGTTATGNTDAFVAKVAPGGAAFVYKGYIGRGTASAIAVDSDGGACVVGTTGAAPPAFPAAEGPDLSQNGGNDAFVVRVVPQGTSLQYAGYVGGSGIDVGMGVGVDAAGDAYVAGTTTSDESTFPALVGPDLTYNGASTGGFNSLGDTFLAKVHFETVVVIDSFFLPKKVIAKPNAKTPSKSFLAANGIFDTGSKVVDLTAPATLTVGGLRFDIPGLTASPDGRTFTYQSGGTRLIIKPNPFGSSRAKFRLKAVADLTGKVDLDGTLDVRFTNPAADGRCRVLLGRGVFGLGKVRGALLEPNLNVQRARATLGKSGGDKISLVVGLASAGATPATASDFAVAFGALSTTVPAAQFSRSGDRYVFKGDVDGITSVLLDYRKEQIFVTGRGLALGDIPQGASPQEIRVGLGADLRAVRVRVARSGATLKY